MEVVKENDEEHYDDFNLPSINFVRKIGEFKVNDKVVIGDTDWSELNLQPGVYEAYKVDDNLMIVNANLNVQPNEKNILEWTWTHSGTGIGVDSGCFGFYDHQTVANIMKYKNVYDYCLPYVNASIKELKNGVIAKGSHITDDDLTPEEQNQYGPFGVVSHTGTGDGGFECFTVSDDRAILIGQNTGYKIYGEGSSDDDDNYNNDNDNENEGDEGHDSDASE